MCGITLCIRGIKVSKLQFYFDLFQLYRENPFNSFSLSQPGQEYLQYMLENKLYINDFSPQHIFENIKDRGPDVFRCFKVSIPLDTSVKPLVQEIKETDALFTSNIFDSETSTDENIEMFAACSVLHLRGEENHPVAQPLFDSDTQNLILYNGEIFNVEKNYLEEFVQKKEYHKELYDVIATFDPFDNDTKQFLNILNSYSKFYKMQTENGKSLDYLEDVRDIVNCFNADFGFTFVDILNRKISFGKDIFGKRGLVLGLHPNGFCLSSCAINTHLTEADLRDDPVDQDEEGGSRRENEPAPEQIETTKEELKNHSGLLKQHLKQEFLEKKYNNEYFMALEKTWVEIPSNKIISASLENDLRTFSFNQIGLSYLKNIFSMKNEGFNSFEENSQIAIQKAGNYLEQSLTNILKNIIAYKDYFERNSVEEKKENEIQQSSQKSELSILFSGGLDSTLLALLCSKILPEGAP